MIIGIGSIKATAGEESVSGEKDSLPAFTSVRKVREDKRMGVSYLSVFLLTRAICAKVALGPSRSRTGLRRSCGWWIDRAMEKEMKSVG